MKFGRTQFHSLGKTLASVEAVLRRHLVGGRSFSSDINCLPVIGASEPVKTPVAREGTTLHLAEELSF